MKKWVAAAAFAATMVCGPAFATDFSFQGTFDQDDDVQQFFFTTTGSSDVILRSWGYAGGVNAAGDAIDAGGFDPILALFNATTGELIDTNDDDETGTVAADPLTGEYYDTYLDIGTLLAGQYIVAVMEYDNFANGPFLSDGFTRNGQGNFTAVDGFTECPDNQPAFNDVSGEVGCGRTNKWAFDILGVESAIVGPPPAGAPEPLTLSLFAGGLAGLGFGRRKRA